MKELRIGVLLCYEILLLLEGYMQLIAYISVLCTSATLVLLIEFSKENKKNFLPMHLFFQ